MLLIRLAAEKSTHKRKDMRVIILMRIAFCYMENYVSSVAELLFQQNDRVDMLLRTLS